MNITGASRIIMCEPEWAPGEETQIVGRAYRMGQEKRVHLYRMHAALSAIDLMMRLALKKKIEIKEDLMFTLARKDDQDINMPRLPALAELQRDG